MCMRMCLCRTTIPFHLHTPLPNTNSVLVKAEAPYPVLHVNEHWTALRGQTQADVEGQPLDLLEVRFG